MSLPRSDSRLLLWSAAFVLTLAACGSGTGDGSGQGGSPGTGGSATGGTTGTGGAGPATGGNNGTGGNGTGGNATGGSGPATGGNVGTGGRATGGAAGAGTGTGGSATGGTGPGTGGAGGKGTGGTGPGTGGAGGKGTGGTATGGQAGTGSATGGSGGASAGMSSGCGKPPTIASSSYNNGKHIAITVGSMPREYILNVPTNYDNTKPYKFVIAYHELNGNDDEMYKNSYYHLMPLSNSTTIFVAPNGQQNNANCTQASGCGWPNTSDTDMKFADAVVAQIEQNFCIDTNRIFATGWSYGASMSEQTACERPLTGVSTTNTWGVRAIAVYSVAYLSNTTNCKATSSKPVAYYASHGTSDSVLPYSGGVTMAQTWAAADGCTAQTPTQATGTHVCTNYAGCATGYPVEFCSFVGDHTPDPKDSGQSTSWEYQNAWNFLNQF